MNRIATVETIFNLCKLEKLLVCDGVFKASFFFFKYIEYPHKRRKTTTRVTAFTFWSFHYIAKSVKHFAVTVDTKKHVHRSSSSFVLSNFFSYWFNHSISFSRDSVVFNAKQYGPQFVGVP